MDFHFLFPEMSRVSSLVTVSDGFTSELVMPSNHLIVYCPLLPASGAFPMSQFFASGGQSIGVSASISVLPMNIQGSFPLGLTGWTSLQFKRLKSLLQHCSLKASILRHSAFFIVLLLHPYMTTGKTIALTRWAFCAKYCLCFLICCLGWP